MVYLKLVTGMFNTHIPYRGTGPMLADLLAGRTQATSAGLPALLPQIRAGKLRAIAVGTPPEIVKRLQEESLKALKSSAVTERFASDSAVGGAGHPASSRPASPSSRRSGKRSCCARASGPIEPGPGAARAAWAPQQVSIVERLRMSSRARFIAYRMASSAEPQR